MIDAAYHGQLDDVKLYIEEEHVSVNAQNSSGCTALIRAAENNQQQVVAYLLSCEGVDVRIKNVVGDTAMHVACIPRSRGHRPDVAG